MFLEQTVLINSTSNMLKWAFPCGACLFSACLVDTLASSHSPKTCTWQIWQTFNCPLVWIWKVACFFGVEPAKNWQHVQGVPRLCSRTAVNFTPSTLHPILPNGNSVVVELAILDKSDHLHLITFKKNKTKHYSPGVLSGILHCDAQRNINDDEPCVD